MSHLTETVPFDIGRFLVSPGRRICGFLVKTRVRPGVVAEITSKVAEGNITILYLSFSRPTLNPAESITALAFLDFTDADISPQALVEVVRRLDFVEEIRTIEPRIQGFMADTVSSHLTMAGDRAVIFRLAALRGLLARVKEHYGPGAGSLLYHGRPSIPG